MDIIGCPELGCSYTAEVVDRWSLMSTGGPVEHLKTRCLGGHVLTPRAESIDAGSAVVPVRARYRRRGG